MDEYLRDPWIDHLTAYGFDVLAIYKGIIARSKGRHREFIQHLIKKCGILQTIKPQIQAFFKSLSPYQSSQQVKSLLKSKFSLSSHSISFLYQEYFWAEQANTNVLFQYLERLSMHHNPPFRLKIKTRRSIFQALVLISPQMYQNFLKFGDVVTVSYNFVPLKRQGFMRSIYLTLFTGVDESGGVVLFGIGVVSGTAYDLKALVINWFIELIDIDKGFSVVSENSQPIQNIFQKLNRNRRHKIRFYENWQHSIDKATFFYRDEMQSKTIIELIKKALKTFNKKDICQLDNRIRMVCRNRLTSQTNYLNKLQKNTMSCMNSDTPSFVGFQVYASKMKMMQKMVTSQFPYCNTLGKLIMQCLKLETTLKQKSENRVNKSPNAQQFFSKNNMLITQELLVLLKCLNFQIFKKLVYNYIAAQNSCRIQQFPDRPLQIIVSEATYTDRQRIPQGYAMQKQQHYKLKYKLQYQHWVCQCGLLEWSGLPCSHMIAVIHYFGGSLFYYINSRWLPVTFQIQQIHNMLSQNEKLLAIPPQRSPFLRKQQPKIKLDLKIKKQQTNNQINNNNYNNSKDELLQNQQLAQRNNNNDENQDNMQIQQNDPENMQLIKQNMRNLLYSSGNNMLIRTKKKNSEKQLICIDDSQQQNQQHGKLQQNQQVFGESINRQDFDYINNVIKELDHSISANIVTINNQQQDSIKPLNINNQQQQKQIYSDNISANNINSIPQSPQQIHNSPQQQQNR